MWIEILLGLLGLLAFFYWWLTTKWDFWTKQGIYQIKPVFPVGSVPALFTKKEHLNDTFLKMAKETEGMPFYGLYLFGGPIFVVQVRPLKNIYHYTYIGLDIGTIYPDYNPCIISILWHYRLWSFKSRDTKLERFLPKNQPTHYSIIIEF